MLVTARLRLTRPFLGELQPNHEGLRKFRMNRGQIVVPAVAWREQFATAARQLGYAADWKALQLPESFRPASIHRYERIYSRVKVEWFESFRAGTVLTLDFMIDDRLPKAPTLEQWAAVLRFTGDRLGLSPFGSKFGFGRFDLLSLEKTNANKYERGNESAGTCAGADQGADAG